MTGIDWTIIVVYLLAMVGLSVFLGRGQEDAADYYVGGRNLPWWAVGISTMATQSGAISFISIPAFVALKPGGGMTWLQYELAVPLAMIAVAVLFLPFFRHLQLISVYEYLELRFGLRARLLMSGVFLISRGLGTGVGLYAAAIVLAVCLGIPVWMTILILGGVTLVYDTIGGIATVVYSDVIQLVVLLGGLGALIYYAAELGGGVDAVIDGFPQERWRAIDLSTGIFDGSTVPFWGFLIGGLFLYASYYGVDQSQAQRELSAPTLRETKFSLVFNGLARFPLTLLYVAAGVAAGAALARSPELQALVPAGEPDQLVPQLILTTFPAGIRGIVFAAILAAAMSSLDSSLNSISAATMHDFIQRGREMQPHQALRLGKVTTVAWGVIITALAFVAELMPGTVIESINKIGSAFYGPILAAFTVGVLSRRVTERGVISGVIAGVGTNVLLWLGVPSLHWMWWNFVGLFVAVVASYVVSALGEPPPREQVDEYTLAGSGLLAGERAWIPVYAGLAGYFVVILLVLIGLQVIAA